MRPAVRGTSRLPWILLGLCTAWAGPATYLAVSQYREVMRLSDEGTIREADHDARIRALTRRLVGVASHQMLEQDGLAERLADIIVRQDSLESRDTALAITLEQALATSGASHSKAPAQPETPPTTTPTTPTIPPARKGVGVEPSFANTSLRGRFAGIEGRLNQVEERQFSLVERQPVLARERIERVKGVLAELQLALVPAPSLAPPRPVARDRFLSALAEAKGALTEAGRWRSLNEMIPLRPPIDTDSRPSSNFGVRNDPFTGERRMHAGMDFRSPIGTPVRTAGNGRVVTAVQSGGYGNLVEVDHGHDIVTRYAHLSNIAVSIGQAVQAGTVIGAVGSTGRSTGPHLHYETRLSGNPVDPARFLAAGEKLLAGLKPLKLQAQPDPSETAD